MVLLGHSMGCQVILEYANQRPDRVAGLIPMFGTFGHPLDTFMDSPLSRPAFDVLARLVARGGRRAARMMLPLYDSPIAAPMGGLLGFMDRHYAGRVDIDEYLQHLAGMNPRIFRGWSGGLGSLRRTVLADIQSRPW